MIPPWLTAYARDLGRDLPPRVRVDGYEKGDVWAPPEESLPPVSFVDVEELAGRGLFVFPLKPGLKEPDTPHGFQDAARAPDQLERWWHHSCRCNVAIVTGSQSGVVVVDLDGDTGMASFTEHVIAGLPPTWCALTPGGVHFYFAHPGGEMRLPNTRHKLGQEIDTRGDGGYAVAPPSVLACGVPYRWLLAPWELEEPAPLTPKIMKAWLPERTSQPPRFEPRRSFEPGQDGNPRTLAWLEQRARELATAPKGTRDALLTKLAYAAGARVLEGNLMRSAAEQMLLGAVAAWGPVSRRDQAKVTNGITAGMTGKH